MSVISSFFSTSSLLHHSFSASGPNGRNRAMNSPVFFLILPLFKGGLCVHSKAYTKSIARNKTMSTCRRTEGQSWTRASQIYSWFFPKSYKSVCKVTKISHHQVLWNFYGIQGKWVQTNRPKLLCLSLVRLTGDLEQNFIPNTNQ